MARAVWTALATLALGCASGAKRTAPAAPAVPEASAERSHPEEPAPLPPRAGPACILEAQRLQQAVPLYLRANARPFARLAPGPKARVEIPTTDTATAARLELTSRDMRLEGVIPARALPLYLTRAILMEGFVLPLPQTVLGWTSAAHNELTVSFSLDRKRFASPREVVAAVDCEAVALISRDFEHDSLLPQAKLTERGWTLRAGMVPLRVAPEQDPVATLAVEPGQSPVAYLYDSRVGHTRVHLEFGDFIMIGWIPEDALEIGEIVEEPFDPYAGLWLRGEEPAGTWSCPHEVQLKGRLDDDLLRVGSLSAGTKFVTLSSKLPRHVAIDLPSARWLKLEEGAQLLVTEGALEQCRSR